MMLHRATWAALSFCAGVACIDVAPPGLLGATGGAGTDGGGGVGGSAGGGGHGGDVGVGGYGGGAAALPVCSPTAGAPCATVLQIAALGRHSCARFDDGTTRCWGGNDAGQLGIADVTSSAFEPPTVSDLPPFDAIGVGQSHGCGLFDGAVSCWGDNAVGQLGSAGPASPNALPVTLGRVDELHLTRYTSCAMVSGKPWCWGLDINGQNEWPPGLAGTYSPPTAVDGLNGETVIQLALSHQHACVLLEDDEVRCWGRGQAFRLGTGNEDDQLLPTPVVDSYPKPVHKLAVGDEFGCVIAGTPPAPYCWGYFNSFHWHNVPTLYDGWIDQPYLDVQLGFRTMCVLDAGGGVRCAGTNADGQVPASRNDPEPSLLVVPDLGTVTQLAVGRYHLCALNTDNEVRCWGRNTEGELGRGFTSAQEPPAPVVWP